MTDDSSTPPADGAQNQPQNQPTPSAGGQPATNPYTMGALAHGLVVTGFLIPLIIWLIGKDQSKFTDEEGKKALNFSILVTIAYVIASIVWWFPLIGWLIGGLIWLAAVAAALIFGIQNAIAANKGEPGKYPIDLGLVK